MNCLLCHQKLASNLKFHNLFLLRANSKCLCEKCELAFPKISDQHCPRCWKDGELDICKDCLGWESKGVSISHHAIFNYKEAMKDYFSNYKFQGNYQLRFAFSNAFKELVLQKNEVIVPIPLSEKRLIERGFNQVAGFLDAASVSYQELLIKSDSIKQSSLTRSERLKSKNVFKIAEDVKIPEKVLLIDDIYTTGATLVHASQRLYDSGVKEIRTFSLCR